MKLFIKSIVLMCAALMFSSAATAAEKATREEAIAMVKKAAAFLKENGKEKALLSLTSRMALSLIVTCIFSRIQPMVTVSI